MNNKNVLTLPSIFKAEVILDQFIKTCLDSNDYEYRLQELRQLPWTYKCNDSKERRYKEQTNHIQHFFRIFNNLNQISYMNEILRVGTRNVADFSKTKKLYDRIIRLHSEYSILNNARYVPLYFEKVYLINDNNYQQNRASINRNGTTNEAILPTPPAIQALAANQTNPGGTGGPGVPVVHAGINNNNQAIHPTTYQKVIPHDNSITFTVSAASVSQIFATQFINSEFLNSKIDTIVDRKFKEYKNQMDSNFEKIVVEKLKQHCFPANSLTNPPVTQSIHRYLFEKNINNCDQQSDSASDITEDISRTAHEPLDIPAQIEYQDQESDQDSDQDSQNGRNVLGQNQNPPSLSLGTPSISSPNTIHFISTPKTVYKN
jgi:hypothetical protein